jgi:hypothetical protein
VSEAVLSSIAKMNDLFRGTFIGGKVVMTQGVAALPEALRAEVLTAVREFTAFTEDNDPHGEHDFGSFTVGGEEFFFKIDYYDPTMTYGSTNPADPKVTIRVLTIMLVSEY